MRTTVSIFTIVVFLAIITGCKTKSESKTSKADVLATNIDSTVNPAEDFFQYANGGWPQYYPDSALYRSQVTYNDDAMMNVMNVLQDIIESKNDLDVIDRSLIPSIVNAVQKGVQCILKTTVHCIRRYG